MLIVRRILLLLVFVGACFQTSHAQQSPFSLGLQAGVSYSGWNLALVGQYHLDDFSAYIGPSISLNRGLPGKGPAGFCTGLNYAIPSTKSHLSSLINIDYQFNTMLSGLDSRSFLSEFHLSYGLVVKVSENFNFVQTMGYGGHLETLKNGDSKSTFSGYGGLLRLKADYHF